MSTRPAEALMLGCTDGAQEGGTTCTLVFQAEIYAIKAYIIDSIERGYTDRNIYFLSNSRNHQGPWQLPDEYQISLGLPSIPGKTDRI